MKIKLKQITFKSTSITRERMWKEVLKQVSLDGRLAVSFSVRSIVRSRTCDNARLSTVFSTSKEVNKRALK